MQRIKDILGNNKANSNESKALDKLDNIEITYADEVITINNHDIRLATILAKLLSDNENNMTSASWLAMLAQGFTNQNKQKASNAAKISKTNIPLTTATDTIAMSASDFRTHRLGLYRQFEIELNSLLARYGVTCFESLGVDDIFDLQDDVEYQSRLDAEKVSSDIISKIDALGIVYESISKNGEFHILIANEDESLTAIKTATEVLKKLFKTVSRYEYTVTFGVEL